MVARQITVFIHVVPKQNMNTRRDSPSEIIKEINMALKERSSLMLS